MSTFLVFHALERDYKEVSPRVSRLIYIPSPFTVAPQQPRHAVTTARPMNSDGGAEPVNRSVLQKTSSMLQGHPSRTYAKPLETATSLHTSAQTLHTFSVDNDDGISYGRRAVKI